MAKTLALALYGQAMSLDNDGLGSFSSLPALIPFPLTPLLLLLNTRVWSRVRCASRGSAPGFAVGHGPLSAPCCGSEPQEWSRVSPGWWLQPGSALHRDPSSAAQLNPVSTAPSEPGALSQLS